MALKLVDDPLVRPAGPARVAQIKGSRRHVRYDAAVLVTKTVYSLYLPETRAVVDALWAERPHAMYERNYERGQDAMHEPFLAAWRSFVTTGGVRMPSGAGHVVPTAGASEGIFAVMAALATGQLGAMRTVHAPKIHVLEGEYEGYGHVAAAVAMPTVVHPHGDDALRDSLRASVVDGDVFFVSAPSAVDGNVWSGLGALLRWVSESLPELRVVVDLTYVGCVDRPIALDLDVPAVAVVLGSSSKPFGVYYHRIGALWSRDPIASLYGNLWFKNLFSLELGRRLLTAFGPTELPRRHRALQAAALRCAIEAGDLPADAATSDVLMLAHARLDRCPESLAPYRRVRTGEGGVLRFCLSPAIDAALVREDASR